MVKRVIEYDGKPKEPSEAWDLVQILPHISRSQYNYALSKLRTTELAIGSKHTVLGVSDRATNVIFAYAVVTKGHKLVSLANLGSLDMKPILERIDFKRYQL